MSSPGERGEPPGGGDRPRSARRRRRRAPEVAEREIVDAAEAMLREQPFRELTVDEVMRRTELSRPSFYVYFRDRHDLVLRVVERLGGELFAMSDRWLAGTDDGRVAAREAIAGIVRVFVRHGPVLRALADAATDDLRVEEAYNSLLDGFIAATAEHIDEEIAAGNVLPMDARESATALVWMMERYLQLSLGRPPLTDPAKVAETLTTIWTRVLYGSDKPIG